MCGRLVYARGRVALPEGSKTVVWAVLFAWPVAVAAGWLLGRAMHADWPMALLPILWLGVIFLVFRGYASSDSR